MQCVDHQFPMVDGVIGIGPNIAISQLCVGVCVAACDRIVVVIHDLRHGHCHAASRGVSARPVGNDRTGFVVEATLSPT